MVAATSARAAAAGGGLTGAPDDGRRPMALLTDAAPAAAPARGTAVGRCCGAGATGTGAEATGSARRTSRGYASNPPRPSPLPLATGQPRGGSRRKAAREWRPFAASPREAGRRHLVGVRDRRERARGFDVAPSRTSGRAPAPGAPPRGGRRHHRTLPVAEQGRPWPNWTASAHRAGRVSAPTCRWRQPPRGPAPPGRARTSAAVAATTAAEQRGAAGFEPGDRHAER